MIKPILLTIMMFATTSIVESSGSKSQDGKGGQGCANNNKDTCTGNKNAKGKSCEWNLEHSYCCKTNADTKKKKECCNKAHGINCDKIS